MTTRIEFKLDIDNDFSEEYIAQSETNALYNEHLELLTKIKSKIEATLADLGYEIERSRLSIYELDGTFLDKTKTEEGDFLIKETPFDL